MAWSNLLANQMVSYTDAQSGGFTLLPGQSNVSSTQCMTKANMQAKYNLNASNLSTYISNQLVPKIDWIANSTQNYQCGLEGTGVITNTNVSPSVPSITLVTTTNPTNQAGTNGTAMITFSGGVGPFTYKLNSVAQGAVTSPFTINGLSSSTSYTVQIIDSNSNTDSELFTLGQSSFYFDAEYIMLTYEFTDGGDLDTKTILSKITTPSSTISPVPGQNTVANYLGYDRTWNGITPIETRSLYIETPVHNFPVGSDTPILTWGGDNTARGFESVLIDVRQFKIDYPTATSFVIDCRCLWWDPDTIGVAPVKVAATLWKNNPDEAPVHDGCSNLCWTNPSAVLTGTIDSVSKTITANEAIEEDEDRGERLATLTYVLTTKRASFNNNDTTTNVV